MKASIQIQRRRPVSDHRFLPALRLALAIATLSLVASTWPLWTGSSSFPQIPFLECLCEVSDWADSVTLGLILGGALATLFGSTVSLIDGGRNREATLPRVALRLETLGPWLLAIGLASSSLLNQHRLQPWAWHFILLSPVLARPPRVLDLLNRGQPVGIEFNSVVSLTVCIYAFSAVSKLDATFHATYGRQLVEALVGAVGGTTRFWPDWLQSVAAVLLPLGEATVAALLLLSPRLHRFGFPLAITMHVLLLVTVGPLGLNHQPGVLIWNAFFIAQSWILWSRSKRELAARTEPPSPTASETADPDLVELLKERESDSKPWWRFRIEIIPLIVALHILTLGMLLPFLHLFGSCDPWPAWAIYASQPARVTILLDEAAANNLPADMRQFVQPRRLDDGRFFFRVDLWSIETTGAPIYPGDRFSVAVANSLEQRPELHDKVDVAVESPSAWWTGKRTAREYRGTEEISRLANGFWINTRPRR